MASRVFVEQTFLKTSAINAKYQRHTELEFRNRRWSPDPLEGRHASRRLHSNFRFGIFGSIRNPFSHCRRTEVGTAFDEYGYSLHSLPLLASSSHPHSLRHPSRPILLLVSLERDRDPRAREEQTAARPRRRREAERREEPTSKWILIVLLVAPRDRRWLRRYSCYPWLKPLGRRVLRRRENVHREKDRKREMERETKRDEEAKPRGPFI